MSPEEKKVLVQAEIKKLNIVLFHRENGLSHPDLQIDIALLKERIETALSYLPECPQKAIGFLKGGEEIKAAKMTKQKVKIFSSPEKGMTGDELRRLRNGAGLSQEALAAKMGYQSKTTVQQWEAESALYFAPAILKDLLEVLNASP